MQLPTSTRPSDQRGIAMITVLLVLMLMSALLVGFTTVVMSDQRYRFIDRDRNQAFYAASAGVEKLTADLGNLFLEYVAPTAAQVTALTATGSMPSISGVSYSATQAAAALPASQLTTYHCFAPPTTPPATVATKSPVQVGSAGYTVTFCQSIATGNPTISDDSLTITGTSAYSGMIALQTPYQIDVTAKTATGGEVHLTRTMQAVAIPVFQFAMFSDPDLSFFAGSDFTIGGRIHTNGNLWLAAGPSATLTTTGKITALKDVVRQFLSNGVSIDVSPTWVGTVSLATGASAPTGNRTLLRTEGSVTGMPAPTSGNWSGWQGVSMGASPGNYNGYLRNGPTGTSLGTGAKKLSLPVTASGVTGCTPSPCTNVEIVRRPLVGEPMTSILYNERLFTKASVRILLSDTAADITSMPGIAAGAPINLETNWNLATNLPSGYTVGLATPPPALSPGARKGKITAVSTQSSPTTYSITMATSDATQFKPRFGLCGNSTPCTAAPTTPITCEVRTGTTFSTCSNVPATTKPAYLSIVSPAGALGGITSAGATSSNTTTSTTTLTFPAGTTTQFDPLPMWDVSNTPPTLINCGGDYSVSSSNTTFTGCYSPTAPATNDMIASAATADPGVSSLGGFIKIERQNTDTSWTDVTLEVLKYGIGDTNANLTGGSSCGTTASISPNAIIRLERLRDNGGQTCDYNTTTTGALDPTNWWPNVLFDTREALQRDSNYPGDTNYPIGGVMHYVNIDVRNLQRWFKHSATGGVFNVVGSTGNLGKIDGTGFSVYFSDRRNNRNVASLETGEYGWEDFVNPGAANGLPASAGLDTGEDVNENGTLEVYGGVPNYLGAYSAVPPCAGSSTLGSVACTTYSTSPTTLVTVPTNASRPTSTMLSAQAIVNRPVLFRRALMLSNAANIGADPTTGDRLTGLTIVSENPVYMKGDWNANIPAGTGFTGVNAATSVIADAVTLLSNAWTDAESFTYPYAEGSRNATSDGWYRVAIIAGKGPAFPLPTIGGGIGKDFGTDGGAHNFLRMLEDWSGRTVNYLGSLASLYYNRQAVGTFKCCTTVYGVPVRAFDFDTNFLNPSLLPPLTPMFRDMNVIGFSQELRPGK